MRALSLGLGHAFFAVIIGAALVVACGGEAPPPGAPASPTPPASTPTAAGMPTSWSERMTKEQQVAFMKTRVVPAMGPVFKAHDATRYADFGCTTCHGPANKDPHEFLPHLVSKNGELTAFTEKPQIAKFMAEEVEPKMADAMGLPHYDMKTKQGFGCEGCHSVDKK